MPKNLRFLERLYIFLFIADSVLVTLNHYLVNGELGRAGQIELVLTIGFFAIAYVMYTLYKRVVNENLHEYERLKKDKRSLEDNITEAFQYIGKLNIQLEEIRSVFSGENKYPESRSQFKVILKFLSDKVLALTDIDWVCLKIIDISECKILAEQIRYRGSNTVAPFPNADIGCHNIINGKLPIGVTAIYSSKSNGVFKIVCLVPGLEISKEQRVLVKAIVNQLEMFYLIYVRSGNTDRREIK
ncbi:MAG: hypothetical protein WCK11_02655 [Candidatus Falkowbacteria bacterium]